MLLDEFGDEYRDTMILADTGRDWAAWEEQFGPRPANVTDCSVLVDTFGRIPGSGTMPEEDFAAREAFIDQLRAADAYPPELDHPMTIRR